jgi:hypothetical protein
VTKSVLVATLSAAIIKVVIALTTYGTNDILFFEGYKNTALARGGLAVYEDGAELKHDGVVYHREPCWHPPFLIHVLLILDRISKWTSVPFRFWFRALDALADCLTAALLLRLRSVSEVVAVLVALSPISILISGFHGNTDPIVLCLLLTAVFFAERRHASTTAGCFYGLSCALKLWPAIVFVAFVGWFASWKDRLRFAGAAGICWILAGLPYLAWDPVGITKTILGYRGVNMLWGIRFVTLRFGRSFDDAVGQHGPILLFALIAAISVLLVRRRVPLHASVAILALIFLVLTPAFGYQYLVWSTPALVLMTAQELVVLSVLGGTFLGYTYYAFSDVHWLANTLVKPRPWLSYVLAAQLWALLALLVGKYLLGALSKRANSGGVVNEVAQRVSRLT